MDDVLNLPKVSFIVITHNFSNFVCDCLTSIKNQTYKNFEIIVVDDVSKDDTSDKIKKFKEENPQLDIKFLQNENNIGQLASFFQGVREARGQFVCSIDGDDILFPEYCAMHVETHLRTPVAMTTCLQTEIDENNVIHTFNSIDSPGKKAEVFKVENKTYEEFLSYRAIRGINTEGADVRVLDNNKYSFATWHWGPASSAMMRKSVCEMLLQIEKTRSLKITADKFLFSFCHLIGSSAIINKVLFAYRRHSSNYSLANPVMGNKKYFKERTQNNYFRNNKKIRSQMFKFVYSNREYFISVMNRSNLMLVYKRIIFSLDRSFFKGLIKSLFI